MSERFADRPRADLDYPRQVARTRDFTSGRPRTFTVAPDGSRVVFLRSRGGDDPVLCLWVLDVATAEERAVFDPRGAPGNEVELTRAERARRERMRERSTGVVAYACDRGVTRAVFVASGRLLVADLADGGTRELEVPGVPDDPQLSPDGTQVSFVVDGALWIRPVAVGEPRRLTPEEPAEVRWGLAEFAAAEELGRRRGSWWSPDGSMLAVARVDERPVEVWWIPDPTDPAAAPIATRYPRVGTANAVVTLHVVEVATGRIVDVPWDDPDRFEYLSRVDWDEHGLTFEVTARDFSASRILLADPDTGAAKQVAEEVAQAWIEPIDGLPARLGDGRLVTSGPVEGVRAVLVDGDPVSPPGFHLASVQDTRDDLVWCTSSYGDPTQDHVWTVGPHREATRVTTEHGVHTATVGGPVAVITSRLEDRPGVRAVVHAGERTVELATLSEEPVVTPATRYLRLGAHGLAGALHLPNGAEPSGPLPVLVSSYGGPGFREVIRWQGMFHEHQWFADRLGVAVLSIDGRGTPGHDLGWEHAIHHDFAMTLDDQVAGLRAAADELGFLDLDRVAFRGWSFGGMLAAMAVLRRPDVFHAAVSGAPVTDQRLYDTAYTERFLGHPDAFPEAYRISSPLTYVDDATPHRALLLIHGLSDDNVFVANTLQLSAALFARGYRHDLILLPNASHIGGFDELVTARYLAELDFLRGALDLPLP